MKTFATATLLALLATGAMAQQPAPSTQQPGSPPAARTAQPPTQEAKGPWLASAFMRSAVYNMAGERIGDVNDLALDESGKVTAVIIGVGGFLGIGEKDVSMKLDEIKRMVHSDGKTYFTVNATKDQLKAAPDYKRT
jgi:sporulation protein YlmC with PRC-barrel domain